MLCFAAILREEDTDHAVKYRPSPLSLYPAVLSQHTPACHTAPHTDTPDDTKGIYSAPESFLYSLASATNQRRQRGI